jgi:hypothetical protein
VVLLFLAFLFLCFSHTLFTQSPSLSLSSSFVETNTP